jgi:hypothetical protein
MPGARNIQEVIRRPASGSTENLKMNISFLKKMLTEDKRGDTL